MRERNLPRRLFDFIAVLGHLLKDYSSRFTFNNNLYDLLDTTGRKLRLFTSVPELIGAIRNGKKILCGGMNAS